MTEAKQAIPKVFLLAVRDAYLRWDAEDYCEKGIERCGECCGCAEYRVLRRAWKRLKVLYPELTQT